MEARVYLMYKVGDKVWYTQYYNKNYVAIESTITEIDDHARKKHPSAILFYNLDFIIGHNITDDKLLDSEDEVIEYFEYIIEDEGIARGDDLNDFSFDEYQHYKKEFIKSTWESNGYEHPGFEPVDMDRKILTLQQYLNNPR